MVNENVRMNKIVFLGTGDYGNIYCRIQLKQKDDKGLTLSITGVEGPGSNGNWKGACGQIYDSIEINQFGSGWSRGKFDKFLQVWRKWHLNDMRSYCTHQKALWDFDKQIELIHFSWGDEFHRFRAGASSGALDAKEYMWYQGCVPFVHEITIGINAPKFMTPRIQSMIDAGLVKVGKKEIKSAGRVHYSEHLDGLLMKSCPVCDYRYGSAWLFEAIPDDVVEYLESLPSCPEDKKPVWV